MAFAYVYVLAQQADPSSAKNAVKKEQRMDFYSFGIINRLMVDTHICSREKEGKNHLNIFPAHKK